MLKVKDFEVTDLGIENSQYFQGYGVCGTNYSDCCYGVGDNPKEALDDCLDQIASSGDIDVEDLESRILKQYPDFSNKQLPSICKKYGDHYEDMFYYIGIRYNKV